MTNQITREDVESLLSTETAKSITELAEELHEGDDHCSECGRAHESFSDVRDQVKTRLREMMDRNRITSTPDWNYRLARRHYADNGEN